MAAKVLQPFSPLRSQQLPGGSVILDQIQDRLKTTLDGLIPTVNTIVRVLDISSKGEVSSGGQTFDFGDNVYEGTGATEQWRAERTCDFPSAATPSLAIVFAGFAAVTGGGPGIFRVRAGGTPHAVDGTEIARITVFASGFALVTYRSTAPNPGVVALLKITSQAVAGQTASIKGVSITVR